MKKARIVIFGDPVLRIKSQKVNVFHKKIHKLIDTMKYTLELCDGGAALAAPQIAVSKKVIVINYLNQYYEMVNPEILCKSGENIAYEGCLSLPGFVGKVSRAEKIKLKFQDRFGKEKISDYTEEMARCVQHEIDHLDGLLYIDRMEEEYIYNNEKKYSVKDLLAQEEKITI